MDLGHLDQTSTVTSREVISEHVFLDFMVKKSVLFCFGFVLKEVSRLIC